MNGERAICRTPEESFAVGWQDGADDAPMTQEEIEHLVALHSPYLVLAK